MAAYTWTVGEVISAAKLNTLETAAWNAGSVMTTLGDILYGAASGTATRLAGNATTTRKFLRQTGDGAASAAPAWDTLVAGDLGTTLTPQFARMGLGVAADGTIPFLASASGNVQARLSQSSTGEVGLDFTRAGGTASTWTQYLPSGSTDLRFYANGADRFTFTQAGAFTATAGLSGTTGTFTDAVTLSGSTAANRTIAFGDTNTAITESSVANGDLTVKAYRDVILQPQSTGAPGVVRIPTLGDGTASFTGGNGTFTTSSDERLKRVQGPYEPGLAEILKVKPIRYKWREDIPEAGIQPEHVYAGFSAQNVRDALGDLAVGQRPDGILSLQDRAILGALVNAVKELSAQVEAAVRVRDDTIANLLAEMDEMRAKAADAGVELKPWQRAR